MLDDLPCALYMYAGNPYPARIDQVISKVSLTNNRVEAYVVLWDDGDTPSRVAARDVTPIGNSTPNSQRRFLASILSDLI